MKEILPLVAVCFISLIWYVISDKLDKEQDKMDKDHEIEKMKLELEIEKEKNKKEK